MKKIPKIGIAYFTEDKRIKDICQDYWQISDGGEFTNRVSDIKKKYNIVSSYDMIKTITKNCNVFLLDQLCITCNKPVQYFKTRNHIESLEDKKKLCDECREKEREGRHKEYLEKEAKERAERFIQLREAFEDGVYEQLDNLQFNFLVSLALSEHFNGARRKMGLSYDVGERFIKELAKKDLVSWDISDNKYEILPELKKALVFTGMKKKVKSIFSSPPAEKLYRKLKSKYLFVYPEIPLRVFIEESAVKDLFTEDWHRDFFVFSRVDFLVCDYNGFPEFAVEYDGSYHNEAEQEMRDKFKDLILNHVGLSVERVSNGQIDDIGTDTDEK